MSNPFAQGGGWDAFDDSTAAQQQPPANSQPSRPQQPQRPAPPPPNATPALNPFAQNPFAGGANAPGGASGPSVSPPPAYEAAAGLPPPPAYDAATTLPLPPPAYHTAAKLPSVTSPPPPSYQAATTSNAPARTAPPPPAYDSLGSASMGTRTPAAAPKQPAPGNLMDLLDAPLEPASSGGLTAEPAAVAPRRTAPPPPPQQQQQQQQTAPARAAPPPPNAAAKPTVAPAAAPKANPFAAAGAAFAPLHAGRSNSPAAGGRSDSSSSATSNPFAAAGLWGAVKGSSDAARGDASGGSYSSSRLGVEGSLPLNATTATSGPAALGMPSVTDSDLDWLSSVAAGPQQQQEEEHHRQHRHIHKHRQQGAEEEQQQRQHSHLRHHRAQEQQAQQEQQGQQEQHRHHHRHQHDPEGQEGLPDVQKLRLGGHGSAKRRGSAHDPVSSPARKGPSTNRNVLVQEELHMQVRLAPLHPKASAPIKHLAAGLGCLFAAPSLEPGGMLQWGMKAHDHQAAGSAASSPASSKASLPRNYDVVPGLPAGGTQAPGEDWDSAPCAGVSPQPALQSIREGKPPRVSCLLLDAGSGRLWAGCDDGRVCCWGVETGKAARCQHSWVAHRGSKVKALVLTPWGKVITGSSDGGIRIWTYVRASTPAMPPMKWRSLKKQGNAPHYKVVRMVLAANGRILWTSGTTTVSLWDAYSGEYIGTLKDQPEWSDMPDMLANAYRAGHKVSDEPGTINTSGGVDARLVMGPFEGLPDEGDDGEDSDDDAAKAAIKYANKVAGKAGKFLNRLGKRILDASESSGRSGGTHATAADGGYGDINGAHAAEKSERWGSVKHLVACLDGSVWVAYKKGLLEQYSGTAQKLYSSSAFKCGISTLESVGCTIWVGGRDGRIWVLDSQTPSTQKLLRSWQAHVFPIKSMRASAGLVYTLGADGSVKAWSAAAPDAAVTAGWRAAKAQCVVEKRVPVLAVTWNVNEDRPERAALHVLLGERSKGAQLVMIGLQEVEMGTSSVARDAIITNLQLRGRLESGNQNAQAWASELLAALHGGPAAWKRVSLRQMSGILVMVFARNELERHIGEVATASVACGVMGMGGNKGAVAISFSLFRRRVVAVSSHFAAHQEAIESRNADYAKIVRRLAFHTAPATDKEAAAEVAETTAVATESPSEASAAGGNGPNATNSGEDWGAGMSDAELLLWVGDFNYRVDAPPGFMPDLNNLERSPNEQLYDFVHAKISAGKHLDLVPGDQCTREAQRGTIFVGMAEGPLSFLPTYKFEKGRESNRLQHFYDMGEKKRVPSWTDRIWFRGSLAQSSALEVPALADINDVKVVLAGPDAYNSVMEVNASDHKPVYAHLSVTVPMLQQPEQRVASLQALARLAAVADQGALPAAPALDVSSLSLRDGTAGHVTVTSPYAQGPAMFAVVGPGGAPLPPWVQVLPRCGLLGPRASVKLSVWVSKGSAWHVANKSVSLQVLTPPVGWYGGARWAECWTQHTAELRVALQ